MSDDGLVNAVGLWLVSCRIVTWWKAAAAELCGQRSSPGKLSSDVLPVQAAVRPSQCVTVAFNVHVTQVVVQITDPTGLQ